MKNISLVHRIFAPNSFSNVENVLTSGWVAMGEVTKELETKLSKYLNIKNCVFTNSCTSSLFISIASLIKKGEKVITSPFTFASVISAITLAGGIPVLIDIEPDTGGISINSLTENILRTSSTIILSHYSGIPCNQEIIKISRNYNLNIIDDSAHTLGAKRFDNKPIQKDVDVSCLSFNSTKLLSCGEGGALVTNDDDLASKARLLRNYGMTKTSYEKSKEGSSFDIRACSLNFKFNDILSSVLLPQIDENYIENILSKRRQLSDRYNSLETSNHFYFLRSEPGDKPSWLWKPIILKDHITNKRSRIITEMKLKGIDVGIHYPVISDLSFMNNIHHEELDHNNAKIMADSVLTLPCHEGMQIDDVDYIIESLNNTITNQL